MSSALWHKSPGLCFMLYFKFILSINVAFKMRSVAFHLSYTVLHLLTRACVQVFSSPWKALFLKALDHKVIKVGVFDSRGLHSVKHSLWAWVRQFLALCERRLGSFLDVISEQDPEALCFGQFNAGRVSETHVWQISGSLQTLEHSWARGHLSTSCFFHRVTFVMAECSNAYR